MKVALSLLVIFVAYVRGYIRDPGPRIRATKGEIWPKPRAQEKSDSYFVVKSDVFDIQAVGDSCTFLENSLNRYEEIIQAQSEIVSEYLKKVNHKFHKKQWLADDDFLGYLNNLNVVLNGTCNNEEYPALGMDESYTLQVNADPASLSANTIWGILRGLESFSQSVYVGGDLLSLRINKTSVVDSPRFLHRGLLVDTARHYIPLPKLLTNLDAMAYNKMNVFHWHIVDDESFPYVSRKFPELSEKGAYTPLKIYSVADVKEIIEYARVRGIRVVPEFDSPGHTRSWGVAMENLLTQCFGEYAGKLGPIDPTKNSTYDFLADLFEEIQSTFPDEYVHLGGDEVGFECWESNDDITKFMEENDIETYEDLESYYIQKVVNIVNKLKSKLIVWQEVFVNNVTIPEETVVQVWIPPWTDTLSQVVSSGRKALLSACWYLDHLQTGGDWDDFYNCEPYSAYFPSEDLKELIMGGEACMWSEVVNEHNLIPRVWPRASAVAERLWSSENVTDIDDAQKRLEEHACRMNRRGIGAQPPSAAGFCL